MALSVISTDGLRLNIEYLHSISNVRESRPLPLITTILHAYTTIHVINLILNFLTSLYVDFLSLHHHHECNTAQLFHFVFLFCCIIMFQSLLFGSYFFIYTFLYLLLFLYFLPAFVKCSLCLFFPWTDVLSLSYLAIFKPGLTGYWNHQ